LRVVDSKLLEEGCHLCLLDLHLVLEVPVHVVHLLLEDCLAFRKLLVEVLHVVFGLVIGVCDSLLDGVDFRLDALNVCVDNLGDFLA